MSNLSILANVIGFIVVIFVAIAFITLTIFYFKAQKKIVTQGLEDGQITVTVKKDIEQAKLKRHTSGGIKKYLEQREKEDKAIGRMFGAVAVFLGIVVGLFVVFSNWTVTNSNHIWMGDIAMLTIETESMATAYPGNSYLKNEDGEFDEKDRLAQYSFITISRRQAYIDNIQVGDVVAFGMQSADGGEMITIVHRLIGIDYDEKGEPLYTFRGDANSSSMIGEIKIGKDRIVGVFRSADYQGAENLILGCFISYLQSPIGISMVVVAFTVLAVYVVLADKLDNIYQTRYDLLLKKNLKRR